MCITHGKVLEDVLFCSSSASRSSWYHTLLSFSGWGIFLIPVIIPEEYLLTLCIAAEMIWHPYPPCCGCVVEDRSVIQVGPSRLANILGWFNADIINRRFVWSCSPVTWCTASKYYTIILILLQPARNYRTYYNSTTWYVIPCSNASFQFWRRHIGGAPFEASEAFFFLLYRIYEVVIVAVSRGSIAFLTSHSIPEAEPQTPKSTATYCCMYEAEEVFRGVRRSAELLGTTAHRLAGVRAVSSTGASEWGGVWCVYRAWGTRTRKHQQLI